MDRRTFVAGGLALLAVPRVTRAQVARLPYRVGFLHAQSRQTGGTETLFSAMRELGYIEGQNLQVERRYAEGRTERLPGFARELVDLRVDVLVTVGTHPTIAARDATMTLPIVFLAQSQPVEMGLVRSLARPGTNLTGTAWEVTPEFQGKLVELVKEIAPKASRLGVIRNPESGGAELHAKVREEAGRALGLTLHTADIRAPQDLDAAFNSLRRERVDALFVANTPLTAALRDRIVAFAAGSRLPTLYDQDAWIRAGGLASYGVDLDDLVRRTAGIVHRVLKGAKPAELPVELPTKFKLTVNLRTAKALGLTIPPAVLARTDEIIQ